MSEDTYAKDLSEFIAESILEKKGRDILIIELSGKSDICDYFVLATVDSELQMKAVETWVEDELKDRGVKPIGRDGELNSDWYVLDYGSVIVHLFKPDTRARYDIESMWADVPRYEFTEENVKE